MLKRFLIALSFSCPLLLTFRIFPGARRTGDDLEFLSVVEVEASQARTLSGNCILMKEGAGLDRIDVMRLEAGEVQKEPGGFHDARIVALVL